MIVDTAMSGEMKNDHDDHDKTNNDDSGLKRTLFPNGEEDMFMAIRSVCECPFSKRITPSSRL